VLTIIEQGDAGNSLDLGMQYQSGLIRDLNYIYGKI
jgi:hypothetical protein